VLPFSVVKNLDVFKGCNLDLSVHRIAKTMHTLVLEAVEPVAQGLVAQLYLSTAIFITSNPAPILALQLMEFVLTGHCCLRPSAPHIIVTMTRCQ
jgi:hypothetical protein